MVHLDTIFGPPGSQLLIDFPCVVLARVCVACYSVITQTFSRPCSHPLYFYCACFMHMHKLIVSFDGLANELKVICMTKGVCQF